MKTPELTPVHFFSHGSTMMLGEECESTTYWKKCGDEALANNIKGVVIMVRSPASGFPPVCSHKSHFKIGSTLGLSQRQNPSSHQPEPIQIPSSLRPSLQIRKLQTQPGHPYGKPLRNHAPSRWLQL